VEKMFFAEKREDLAELQQLAEELKRVWPDREFEIINQGVGGTRVGYGLWRLTNEYEFHNSLCSLNTCPQKIPIEFPLF
jgi:hypothetical protein